MVDLVVKVTGVADAFAQSLNGFTGVKRVTFMVGQHGPFSEDFLPGDFTDTNVRNRLESVADTIRKVAT